ncbi:hypothetical protein DFH06DRAFT_1251419 [Mycena polygramma]|nr:hypothetical protein DFH06DRAFT_1251419 [Mycena polygramma]
MQRLATLIALTFSVAHGHLLPRDESITFFLTEPSPTLTNAAVISAYSVYAEKCGTDLDAIANSNYAVYTGRHGTAQITDAAYIQYLQENVGEWDPAEDNCINADGRYGIAL